MDVPEETTARLSFDARRRRVVELRRDGLLSDAEYEAEKAALTTAESRLPPATRRRREVGQGLVLAREAWGRWEERQRNTFLRGLVASMLIVDNQVAAVTWQPPYAGVWPEC